MDPELGGESGTSGQVNGKSVLTGSQKADADRAAFLAGNYGDEGDGETEAKPSKATAKDVDLDDDELEASGDADDGIDLDDVDDEDLEASGDADEDAEGEKPDADTSKRFDAVRRREQRAREAIAAERKAFESERDGFVEQWKPRIEAAERFEAMKARGVNAYNALDVLRELGLSDDDFEDLARNAFALSKTGRADPKNAEAMARSKRERERDEKIALLEKRDRDREEAEKQREAKATDAANAARFIEGCVKVAPAGTLAAHYLEKEPARTRHAFAQITQKLLDRDNAMPTQKAVVAAYEKARAKQLRSFGVDPTTITKAAPAKADAAKKPGDKKTAAKSKATGDESKPLTREDFIRGNFD